MRSHSPLVARWLSVALLLPTVSMAAKAGTEVPGLNAAATYTGEFDRNVRGGLKRGGAYLDNLDLQLEAERGAVFGIPGLSAFAYALYNNRHEFSSEYVGDAQGASSIDAPRGVRLYEAWVDWAPGTEAVSARLGLYDLNSEFDSIETAGLFLNSSHGIGPDFSQTGLNGPSIFPVTSLALRLRATGAGGGYGQIAVLDGVPGDPDDPGSNEIDLARNDGALVVLEGGWSGSAWRKVAVGLWRYTADFDRLNETTITGDPRRDDGNDGWYALADRTLWSNDARAVAGFVRIGQADDRFNPFDTYLGAGISLTGLGANRPEDAIGVAVATAFAGDEYRQAQAAADAPADSRETALELTYRAPINAWLTLQPDIQYIINPGTDPSLDNAFVIALRFELGFSTSLSGD